MDYFLFKKCIDAILKSDKPGFGFVNDLIDTLLAIGGHITNISNIAVIWDYVLNDERKQEVNYFFPSGKLNLVGLNRQRILNHDKPVISGTEDSVVFVERPFLWIKHFVFIPINRQDDEYDHFKTKGALLLLANDNDINLSMEQVELLHTLLNSKQPSIYEALCVKKYLDISQEWENYGTCPIGNRFGIAIKALDALSGNEIDANNQPNGVRYASFWKLNQLECLEDDKFLKQSECCFDKNYCPSTSHEEIKVEDVHFLNEIREVGARYLEEDFLGIMMYNYKDVLPSFTDKQFLDDAGMGDSHLTALVMAIVMQDSINSLDLCCLYVKDIVYTPFISRSFVNRLQDFIKKSLVTVNKEVQSSMVNRLMSTYFIFKKQTMFYERTAKIMEEMNSMEDCLIYTCGSPGELLYVREEDINMPQTFLTKRQQIGNKLCYLPVKYALDKDFTDFLVNLTIFDEGTRDNVFIYRETKPGAIVRSALCVLIQSHHADETSGIIILINKTHSEIPQNVKDFNVITVDNISASYLSALYLHQFGLWNKAVSRKNYLLKKLRHEIPNCTRVIGSKMKSIKNELKTDASLHSAISVHLNTMELNRSRINMLASFFAAVDYDDERFAKARKIQDIVEIINENMPLFKEEAANKGVDVTAIFHVGHCYLNISSFYPLAIVNVVNNAVRYCSRGTNIIIDVYGDRVEVSDIGLPIPAAEMDFIFDDGYRGTEAKARDAEGIGFGLHLTKRVLEAHGSSIKAESDFLSKENYFLEGCVAYYMGLLTKEQRSKFMFAHSEPMERNHIERLYNKINQLDFSDDANRRFCNRREMLVRSWLANDEKEGGPAFVEMEEEWFIDSIAKVTFIIKFGNNVTKI